ncbi:MAG: PEP-utilizing enzyme, partial [Candidatus Sericytochromatia bacterium]
AEQLQEAILASPEAAFWASVAEFLHRYRHHSVSELDITQPRWDEDPTWVLQTLKQYVLAEGVRDPHEANDRQHALYLAERRRAEAHFHKRGLLGRIAGKGFFAKLELMRTYAWWREEIRDRSSRMYALIRRETLAVARLLTKSGALQAPEEVWHLRYPEVIDLLEGAMSPEAARALVAARREEADGYRRFTNPNELGRRFKVAGPDAPPPEGALAGIACSPGVARARVRVVKTIQDGHALRPGEILVTRFTDPGWTPLFSTIAGVVTETGGVLSHAAVIAREYGIPAVLAVPGATARLKDGDWVIVDGSRGTVAPCPETEAE